MFDRGHDDCQSRGKPLRRSAVGQFPGGGGVAARQLVWPRDASMPCGRHPVSLPLCFWTLTQVRESWVENSTGCVRCTRLRWFQEPAWLEVHSERVVRVGWRVGSQRVLKSTAISPQFLAVGPRMHACSLCYL